MVKFRLRVAQHHLPACVLRKRGIFILSIAKTSFARSATSFIGVRRADTNEKIGLLPQPNKKHPAGGFLIHRRLFPDCLNRGKFALAVLTSKLDALARRMRTYAFCHKGKRLCLIGLLPQPEKSTCFTQVLFSGWGSRIRTYECQSQSLVPYRLAIPQNRTGLLYHNLVAVSRTFLVYFFVFFKKYAVFLHFS